MTKTPDKPGQPQKPDLAEGGYKSVIPDSVSAPSSMGIKERAEAVRKRVGKAARGRGTMPLIVIMDIPAGSIDLFLEKADALGFSNFKNANLSREFLEEFNRFLYTNTELVKSALLQYSRIPKDWLDSNNPVPAVFETPRQYAAAMMTALVRDGYRMHLDDEDGKPANYYKWHDVFDAMRAVLKYESFKARRE